MRARILVGCGGLVAFVLLLGAAIFWLQPTSYRIARTRVVSARPAEVRALLGDMSRLSALDPRFGPHVAGRTLRFSAGPPGSGTWLESSGPGGTARLTLLSATDDLVELASANDGVPGATVRFELRPVAAGTEVTLAVSNEMSGLARALWPFANLEGRIAPHLGETLDRLAAMLAPP